MNQEPIKKYLDKNYPSSCIDFYNLPPEVAARLPTTYGYVDLNDMQNDSPTSKKMIEIASKYHGILEGYVITFESKRRDARITFTGFSLPISKSTAYKLKKQYDPTEFNLTEIPSGKIGSRYVMKSAYRFWWD